MSIHQIIKDQIKEAMRSKNRVMLDTLRGLDALMLNEMLASKDTKSSNGQMTDDKALALIKRSVKQRKDSIAQFKIGKRDDLAAKEELELAILEGFLPSMMSRDQILASISPKIEAMKVLGSFDPKSSGKIVGQFIKELAGKADGADVKAVVDELLKA